MNNKRVEVHSTFTISEVRLLQYGLSTLKKRAAEDAKRSEFPSDRYYATETAKIYAKLMQRLSDDMKVALEKHDRESR